MRFCSLGIVLSLKILQQLMLLFSLPLQAGVGCDTRFDDFPIEEIFTTQQELPLPFCSLENLFFDVEECAFLGWGPSLDPCKAICPFPQRGFSFRTFPSHFKHCSRKCCCIEGTTLFLFETEATRDCLSDFFHLIEHIVGIWSFCGPEKCQDVKLIVLASDGCKKKKFKWKGSHCINEQFLESLFPCAKVQKWSTFLRENKNKFLCMERVITSDRALCALSPECMRFNHLLGAAAPLLSQEALDQFALHVNNCAQTIREHCSAITVTFIKCPCPKTLDKHLEKKLLSSISHLPDVILHVVDCNKICFEEQINIIGNTDVLIGVHSPWLCHTLFLPPTACLVEIFPPDCFSLNHRLFADARRLDCLSVVCNRGPIDCNHAFQIGCTGKLDEPIHELDNEPILSFIRSHAQKVGKRQ